MNAPATSLLWYFADPMCSWCWGFSPTIETLRAEYGTRMKIPLVLGGLRPGETAPLTPDARAELLRHWQQVHARTGQSFRFEDALPDGFVYDTEPASRAVVAAGSLDPAQTFAMFTAIQRAFYAEGRNVTRTAELIAIAQAVGLDPAAFATTFDSDATRERTRSHFRQARQAGVRGFPTLILQQDTRLTPVSAGCQPLERVRDSIERALNR